MALFKALGVIYTYAASRTIILDIAPDPSSHTFIRSFLRVSPKECLEHALSDYLCSFIADDTRKFSIDHGIHWHFNLPLAPLHGGFFERIMRITKTINL